jgi:hypothetical protein
VQSSAGILSDARDLAAVDAEAVAGRVLTYRALLVQANVAGASPPVADAIARLISDLDRLQRQLDRDDPSGLPQIADQLIRDVGELDAACRGVE